MDDKRAHHLALQQLSEAASAHQALLDSQSIPESLVSWARLCADSLSAGGAIFFAGNGGSFADAQHLAAELTGKMGFLRPALAGIALGVNSSSISAIGNDFGFENVFARELEGLHRSHSVVVALTTSGNSANIVQLVHQARQMDTPVLVLTGEDGGIAAQLCDSIRVPSRRTERIQEMHILLGHTLCLLIENFLALNQTDPME